eukprot:jgi/Mesen1/1850/ME000143S00908
MCPATLRLVALTPHSHSRLLLNLERGWLCSTWHRVMSSSLPGARASVLLLRSFHETPSGKAQFCEPTTHRELQNIRWGAAGCMRSLGTGEGGCSRRGVSTQAFGPSKWQLSAFSRSVSAPAGVYSTRSRLRGSSTSPLVLPPGGTGSAGKVAAEVAAAAEALDTINAATPPPRGPHSSLPSFAEQAQREAEARVAAAMAYEFLRRFCNASGSSSRFDEFMVGHVGALAVNGAASSLREAFTRYHALDRAARERLLTQVARDLLGYASLERMCEHVQAQHDAAAGASCQLAEEEDAPASSRHVSSSPARSLEAADVAARAALVVPREDREHPRAAPAAAAAVQQQQQQQQQQQEEQEEQEGQEEREMGAEGGGEYEAVLRAAPPCIKFSASEPISLWDHVLPDGTIRSTSSSTSTS